MRDDDFWGGGFLFWWINPGGRWNCRWFGREALEAVRMSGEGRHQRHTTLLGELIGVAVVYGVRGHQADAAVPVDSVVPTEEELAVCTSVFDRTEARREVRSILQGFKLRPGIWIVIRDVRTAMS